MALLKFNKGEWKYLKNQPINEGNVYITTDEQAMYVDVAADKRIRIGQIVDITSEKLTPPYAEGTFYYISDKNALVKYINGGFVQLNGTGDLKARVDDLDVKVNGTKNADGTVTGGLINTVDAIGTRVTSVEETLNGKDGAQGLVAKVNGLIETGGEVNVIEGVKIDGATSVIAPDGDRIVTVGKLAAVGAKVGTADLDTGLENRIAAVETKATNAATKTELQTAQNTLQGKIDAVDGKVDGVSAKLGDTFTADSTVSDQLLAATNRISANENTLTNHGNSISALQTTVGDHTRQIAAHGATIADHTTSIGNFETDINNLDVAVKAAQADATKGITDAATADGKAVAAQAKAEANATAINGLGTRVKAIEDDYVTEGELSAAITGVNNAATTLGNRVTANENAIKALNETTIPGINNILTDRTGRIEALETGITKKVDTTTYEAKVAKLTEDIANNAADIVTANAAIEAAAAKGQKGIDDAKKAQDEIDALETVVGNLKRDIGELTHIMNFKGAVDAKPADDAEGYVTGDVIVVTKGDDAGKEFVFDGSTWIEIGNTSAEQTAIAGLQDRMDDAEADIIALQNELDTAGTGVKARLTAVENKADANETAIGNMYTNQQIDAAIAAAITWGDFVTQA